jgi:hypothetical protein
LFAIEDMSHQRNTLYNILQIIDKDILQKAENDKVVELLKVIISSVPEDFQA